MRISAILALAALLSINAAAQSKPKRSNDPKPTPTRSNAAAARPLDENGQWETAIAIESPEGKAAALRRFLTDFPASPRHAEAVEMLVRSDAAAGDDCLKAGDGKCAAANYLNAAKDIQSPMSETLLDDTLIRIATVSYWRIQPQDAFEIADILEEKAAGNAANILSIARFYLQIENGSEAARLANEAITIKPDANAYQTLGLAERMNFNIQASSVAFAKAVETDPTSLVSMQSLAEAKRSLGESNEALTIYRAILDKKPDDIAAKTGIVLSLFDADKRQDAESEYEKLILETPGNVLLMAGVAYWYAAHGDGEKAVDIANKAINADPRFIWSHIALARGLSLKKDPVAAERALTAARRYGNFPTLTYELAAERASLGFYREAAEELMRSFELHDGKVVAALGFRIKREDENFGELLSGERQASILAPLSADAPEKADEMKKLLDLWLTTSAETIDPVKASAAARAFTLSGSKEMTVFRQLFAASRLLEKSVAVETALDLTKLAAVNSEASLNTTSAAAAILADELYAPRALAATRNEYLTIPDVPRQTLSMVLRGRIEDLAGQALYQQGKYPQATIRLKRAISILPEDNAWWRSAMWHLGRSLDAEGKYDEAYKAYSNGYRNSPSDAVRYAIIKAAYIKAKGSADGLETIIGPEPATMSANAIEASASAVTAESSDAKPTPTPVSADERSSTVKPAETLAPKPLFEPVIIKVTPSGQPQGSDSEKRSDKKDSSVSQCNLLSSQDDVSIAPLGAVELVISADDDRELERIEVSVDDEKAIRIERSEITAIKTRALYLISSLGAEGNFKIRFSSACGDRLVNVRVVRPKSK